MGIYIWCQLFNLFINMKGSVVVFTTYSSWTSSDPESEYYCHKTPMLFAFILLLIKWLLVPAIMVRSSSCNVRSCTTLAFSGHWLRLCSLLSKAS